jgi:hypothetical protein
MVVNSNGPLLPEFACGLNVGRARRIMLPLRHFFLDLLNDCLADAPR